MQTSISEAPICDSPTLVPKVFRAETRKTTVALLTWIPVVLHYEARCCTLRVSMPTNKQRISINLTDGEYAQLAALAERHNLSMAWIGRKAILDFLDHHHGDALQLPLTFGERPERPRWLENGPR
jgi:hypothetical protein